LPRKPPPALYAAPRATALRAARPDRRAACAHRVLGATLVDSMRERS